MTQSESSERGELDDTPVDKRVETPSATQSPQQQMQDATKPDANLKPPKFDRLDKSTLPSQLIPPPYDVIPGKQQFYNKREKDSDDSTD